MEAGEHRRGIPECRRMGGFRAGRLSAGASPAGRPLPLAWRRGRFPVRLEDGETVQVSGHVSPPFGSFSGTRGRPGILRGPPPSPAGLPAGCADHRHATHLPPVSGTRRRAGTRPPSRRAPARGAHCRAPRARVFLGPHAGRRQSGPPRATMGHAKPVTHKHAQTSPRLQRPRL